MSVAAGEPAFVHEALFYGDEAQFLAGTVPFVTAGLAAGDAVMAIVPEPRLQLLRHALGPAAPRVTFMDMRIVGHNPARLIPLWQDFIGRHAASGRRVRGLGEPIWPGRSPEEIAECHIHETLLNRAFAASEPVTILCPYGDTALDASVGDRARRSHARFHRDGVPHGSDAFTAGDPAPDPFSQPLPPPPPDAEVAPFGPAGIRDVRSRVAALAAAAGLAPGRIEDLVLAASEIAANSVRHGGGRGTLTAWRLDDRVVCELADRGTITDPFAGRRRPGPQQDSGRGIWLANQLCDLVQIRVGTHGTVVRLHQRSAPPPCA